MSGGRRKEEPPQPQLANGALKVSVWSKALRSDAAWDDKDEFLDVIYWFRQIIAVVLGVIWGILPLRGFLGIAGWRLHSPYDWHRVHLTAEAKSALALLGLGQCSLALRPRSISQPAAVLNLGQSMHSWV